MEDDLRSLEGLPQRAIVAYVRARTSRPQLAERARAPRVPAYHLHMIAAFTEETNYVCA
jgi:hypothetical protein